ncbi:MAG: hypothetical protein QOI98_32, partial [Solirubrobacteraceae bacterium]|nr:hypothetical protein [Solirubrobacteraceae bacterium]
MRSSNAGRSAAPSSEICPAIPHTLPPGGETYYGPPVNLASATGGPGTRSPATAALVGTGHIARQHLECLASIAGVQTLAVCDHSPVAARAAAERFGVPRWYTDHRRMLAEVPVDVVHVTTPVGSHVEVASDALDAGCHVIVEKPAAPTHAEVRALLETADTRGRWLVEDLNYLFNAPVRRLRALVDGGALGDVVHVEVTLCVTVTRPASEAQDPYASLPGGALRDVLPHVVSLALEFAGPARVTGATWPRPNAPGGPAGELRALLSGERATAALSVSSR